MNQRRGDDHWINPLLAQLNLIQSEGEHSRPERHRQKFEESQLTERIGKVVAKINAAAGYHILEMLEYLAPQKVALQVNFGQQPLRCKMEIMVRNDGIAVVFSNSTRGWDRWRHFLSQGPEKIESVVEWEQPVLPAQVLEQDIQDWFHYLLSGLDEKHRPSAPEQPSKHAESALAAAFRKASA